MASDGRNVNADRSKGSGRDATSIPSKGTSRLREPPPALFLHPSPAASHVSLPGILAPGASISGPSGPRRERSHLGPDAGLRNEAAVTSEGQRGRPSGNAGSTRNPDRTDALWAEMQATLEEVELSASKGTHVFGPEHDRKLAELRTAQIALAQAWARSEADDAIETTLRANTSSAAEEGLRNLKGTSTNPSDSAMGDGTDGAKGTATSSSARPKSSSGKAEQLGAKLEEETEGDILLARKRREANDQYFQRVNNGVIDVVAKLEEVAAVMRAVEQETRDVWTENPSLADSAGN